MIRKSKSKNLFPLLILYLACDETIQKLLYLVTTIIYFLLFFTSLLESAIFFILRGASLEITDLRPR